MLALSLFLFIACVAPLADLWFYPRLERAAATGAAGVRARFYRIGALSSWLLTACVIAVAAERRLPWSELRLGIPTPLRAAIGAAFAIVYSIVAFAQRRALVADPPRLVRVMRKYATANALLPHTRSEFGTFSFLAVTAGVCEEVVYRGFVLWFAAAWLGVWGGVVVSSLLFGFAHIYLGLKHVIRTAMAGLIFALVVLAASSLVPAMIIHALADLIGGDLGFRALSAAPSPGSPE